MVQAERDVEYRISIPRALGVEDDGMAIGAAYEDVFRAEIAVDERDRGGARGLETREYLACDLRMPGGGGPEIGIEAERVEQVVGREFGGDLRITERRAMDAADDLGDRPRGARINAARQEFGLPQRIFVRRQIRDERNATLPILAQHRRRGARDDGVGAFEPADLAVVALQRNAPLVGDAELPERALRDNRAAVGVTDADDVGRDSARQRTNFD